MPQSGGAIHANALQMGSLLYFYYQTQSASTLERAGCSRTPQARGSVWVALRSPRAIASYLLNRRHLVSNTSGHSGRLCARAAQPPPRRQAGFTAGWRCLLTKILSSSLEELGPRLKPPGRFQLVAVASNSIGSSSEVAHHEFRIGAIRSGREDGEPPRTPLVVVLCSDISGDGWRACLTKKLNFYILLGAQDADKFRSKMNSIAYGNVMAKAAEDYKQVIVISCFGRFT